MTPSVLKVVVERMAPPAWEATGLGTVEVEGVEPEGVAALTVPFSCFARAANAEEDRAEVSSELIESTIPMV